MRLTCNHSSTPARLLALLPAMLVMLVGCTSETPIEMPSSAHPIIIIDIDSVRADHLGCYGYARDTSPSIDQLATEAILFEWAFAQAPSTAPSQATILSGLYPTTHGMIDETTSLSDEVVTLAEALSEQGYVTAGFVDGGYLSEGFGFAQGFETYDNSHGAGIDEIGPKALTWLREHAAEDFLLLVHTYDPHVPYDPPEEHRHFAEGLQPETEGFEPSPESMDEIRKRLAEGHSDAMPEGDLEYAKALYDGEIHRVDAWIGELMTTVRELGLDTRATIVVISDHGQEMLEHGDLLHDALNTAVTRVPFIVRLPHAQNAGRISSYVETVDLMPTLLDLAGAPIPHLVQGDSLVPMILGQARPPFVAFSESHLRGGQKAVALAGYRLILTGEDEIPTLANLQQDPLELTDLAAQEPERVEAMKVRLDDWAATVRNTILTGDQSDVDQETLDQLKGLGYIQ